MSRQRQRTAVTKGALSIGFLALGGAVLTAYGTPATDYEVSIYAGTPESFWAGFGLSLLVSLGVALMNETRHWRRSALVLGGAAMVSFVSLPVIRGYYFYASADSMSHLGWVRDIATGVLEPVDLFYPGIHVLATLIHEISGFTLPRSLMLVVVSFVVLYFVFVTLSVRILTDSGLGTAIGAVSAFLLLPINVIVVKLAPHPYSQTVLYVALVFFLLFLYLSDGSDHPLRNLGADGTGVLFILALIALVLFHPLVAVTVLVLFTTVSVSQFASRRWNVVELLGASRPLYVPTLLLALWFGIWVMSGHSGLVDQGQRIIVHLTTFFQGGSTAGGVVVRQRSSIRSVGASLSEIFIKLFLVSLTYAVLAGIVMALSLVDWFEKRYLEATVAMKLVTVGFVVVVPWTLVQFIGTISKLYFRYVGFMMVVGTIFGAFAIHYAIDSRRQGRNRIDRGVSLPERGMVVTASRVGLFVVLIALLGLTTAYNYPSVSLYQPSGHMTEAQFDGHDMIFDLADSEYELSTIGYPVTRYRHAIEGTSKIGFQGEDHLVPTRYNHDLVGYITNESLGNRRYLILSDNKRIERVVVYRGLRYNRRDFRALESGRGVNRVFTNGDVELYLHTDSENETGRSPIRYSGRSG